jgi:hypothetical protein
MASSPNFDLAAAHQYFAADCFNKAWDLLDKLERSAEEDRLMVLLNQASIWHWLNRPDCRADNLSVGYWQASRIQAVLGRADEARRQAEICLSNSHELPPFYLGYAHVAFARAEFIAGHPDQGRKRLETALELAARVEDEEERRLFQNDLEALKTIDP